MARENYRIPHSVWTCGEEFLIRERSEGEPFSQREWTHAMTTDGKITTYKEWPAEWPPPKPSDHDSVSYDKSRRKTAECPKCQNKCYPTQYNCGKCGLHLISWDQYRMDPKFRMDLDSTTKVVTCPCCKHSQKDAYLTCANLLCGLLKSVWAGHDPSTCTNCADRRKRDAFLTSYSLRGGGKIDLSKKNFFKGDPV